MVALVAACVAIIAALIAWLKERSVTHLKQTLDTSMRSYEHMLDREIERIKSQLAAELTTHEVRERLRADLRLRILTLDEERVAEQRKVFSECVQRCNEARLLLSEPNRSREGLDRVAILAGNLAHTGFLLPSELVAPAKAVEGALRALAAPTSVTDLISVFERQQGAVLDRLDDFDALVQTWRQQARSELLGARLGGSGPS